MSEEKKINEVLVEQPDFMKLKPEDWIEKSVRQLIEMIFCTSLPDDVSILPLREDLLDALDTLQPHEAKVLRLRFGLEDGKRRTLEEVGKEFNVNRQRVRQIESKAVRKLRHPSRRKKLEDFLKQLYMGENYV